jgi:phosphatidylglycerol---prolipoprotein diacylglyceryl transferase
MTFHWYGFIIGIAVVMAYLLSEAKAKQIDISEKIFLKFFCWVLVFGVIGARAWHVLTDFDLYQHNLSDVFKIWQGGLSILGVISGGLIGAVFFSWNLAKNSQHKQIGFREVFLKVLDLAAYALPVGQSIGRLANFVNQELYGLPTNLPWKIYIKKENRLSGYEKFDFFHPLFFYEALLMLVFWVILNLTLQRKILKKNNLKFGQGRIFLLYIFYYTLIRFWLDFLRIDRGNFILWNMGVNQLILLFVQLLLLGLFVVSKKNQN